MSDCVFNFSKATQIPEQQTMNLIFICTRILIPESLFHSFAHTSEKSWSREDTLLFRHRTCLANFRQPDRIYSGGCVFHVENLK